MIEYEVIYSADVGSVFSPIGDLLKEVNGHLATAGYDEKLMMRGKPFACTIKSERELTESDMEKLKATFQETFTVMQPAWRVKVESFRRKSGNALQLVVQ